MAVKLFVKMDNRVDMGIFDELHVTVYDSSDNVSVWIKLEVSKFKTEIKVLPKRIQFYIDKHRCDKDEFLMGIFRNQDDLAALEVVKQGENIIFHATTKK